MSMLTSRFSLDTMFPGKQYVKQVYHWDMDRKQTVCSTKGCWNPPKHGQGYCLACAALKQKEYRQRGEADYQRLRTLEQMKLL